MQKLHEKNLYKLTEFLDETDGNDLIMKAAVFRNLGLFEKSLSLLEKVTDPGLSQIKEKFQTEIRKENKKLFILLGRE